ncbi:hypothetical protein [uncultured Chitinophaga sp.]|jgi:hypothetical protein|uniref:hypothetical protein n=1 Tax=uncultured Chitinophaga sp. TaxID=339340 RepID=UPI00261D73CE|nr:hypothetical protein [uncultured Chitinophaga sp.]
MQDQQSSVFDEDFLRETYIRRRQLMPLSLKIFVWFFMITSAFSFINVIYSFLQYRQPVTDGGISLVVALGMIIPGLVITLLNVMANLFLLLEKKWALLLALFVTLLFLVFRCYGTFRLISLHPGDFTLSILSSVFIMSLKIPYVLMLLKIKRDWETKAVAG